MRDCLQLWCSPRILAAAVRVSLVVGTLLNLLNQGGAWWHGQPLDGWRLALNYLVPYLVASHSAVRNELDRRGVDGE
ncbi:nitrate/nitrite transporter NrtS [Thermomonas sp. S9]|uniref:nitrate/nitrite transporter NrtS n=1 Tax=Thermomonas sp. S9 TaxID=2885203 RepID=UPI00216B61E5|nr:nitrate/nitrite transporter NrtS [Thermomonas sp. S9]MCR6496533.1 nitrate/nitrite transporter NrtS [Thermomonas sp. S9]